MEKLSFRIEQFEAPLDLILHLLQRHKLSIFEIDISSLLNQYLEQIRIWQEQNMEVASEFLEMASRLVYIKTVSLLPRQQEEGEKLREELTGQLIDYQLCKLAAQRLGSCDQSASVFTRPPMRLEADPTYRLQHSADLLYQALCDAQGKEARRAPPPRAVFEPLVERPVVSVTSRIFTILRRLRQEGGLKWDRLFAADPGRSSMVATFLAVLELVREGRILVQDDQVLPGEKSRNRAE